MFYSRWIAALGVLFLCQPALAVSPQQRAFLSFWNSYENYARTQSNTDRFILLSAVTGDAAQMVRDDNRLRLLRLARPTLRDEQLSYQPLVFVLQNGTRVPHLMNDGKEIYASRLEGPGDQILMEFRIECADQPQRVVGTPYMNSVPDVSNRSSTPQHGWGYGRSSSSGTPSYGYYYVYPNQTRTEPRLVYQCFVSEIRT